MRRADCDASIPAGMPRRYPSLPSAFYVHLNQRMISRISESLAEPMPLRQGFCSSQPNLCCRGKVLKSSRTYAVVARVLFKLILYDAVVVWKYIQESKRSETDTVSFFIHAGERRRRAPSQYISRLRGFHSCRDAQKVFSFGSPFVLHPLFHIACFCGSASDTLAYGMYRSGIGISSCTGRLLPNGARGVHPSERPPAPGAQVRFC